MKPSDSLITKRLTVVLCPPVKVASTDDIVEDKADEHPEHVVKGGRRRHVARAAEGDWEIDVLEETYLNFLCNIHWNNGARMPARKKKTRP
jgi:hypothetical protein